MRLVYYAGASTAAAAACLVKAFHERPNFYSATVYLSQSNACLLILTNLLLILACSMVYALQRLLYGPLRPIEIEQLSEKAWYAVLDTLLAMPSFREDVGGWLLTMFVLLLAGKVWGWIGEGRVDILEQQPPANPRLFHARLANSLIFSVIFDIWMTRYCFETVAADPRPGMMVIFTFEFAILTVFSTFTLCRYVLSLISSLVTKQQMTKAIEERKVEIRAERAAARQTETEGESTFAPVGEEPIEVDENEVDVPGWEEKRRYLFGLEMTADFLKLLLYIIFFTVSVTFNGLPMHIMRDVYMTFAAFTKRLADYVNYKKATSDMNARYPDATTEEIRDDACIVCREDMIAWQDPAAAPGDLAAGATRPRRDEGLRAKKLPCGHILHLRCLKAWLERQQVCPTCRRPVVGAAAPPPPTNNVQANAAPGAAANPAGPVAVNQPHQPRRPPRHRARVFNLGPLRIGFLNAPANQVDNIVDQIRDATRPQGEGRAAAQDASSTQSAAPSTVRLSQTDIREFGQRMVREASMLNIEQAQLSLLRGMSLELDRLMRVHDAQGAADRTPTGHHYAALPHHNNMPNAVPLQQSALTGHQTQIIAAGGAGLPDGLTLPQGWTLMPLQRHGGAGLQMTRGVSGQAQQAVLSEPSLNTTVPVTASEAIAQPTPQSSSLRNNTLNIGPTDEAGSPLFVPASNNTAQSSTLSAGSQPPTNGENQTNAAQPVEKAPWTTDSWDFSASENADSGGQSGAQAADVSHEGKGKGKAVQIEEEPDSQT